MYLGEKEEVVERNSKDKATNAGGERMLNIMEERERYILNAQTVGDEKGEFTYVDERQRGVSYRLCSG